MMKIIKQHIKNIVLILILSFMNGQLLSEPLNPQIVEGSATINQESTTTSINQSTNNLLINWESFNIKSNETVNFIQPNTSSIAINRVIGLNGSEILGSLNANGQVFIINPNGIIFGQDSQVNVGGLVASTLNISDKNFTNRLFSFEGEIGSITNKGTLTSTANGYIALLSSNVINEGTITSSLGNNILASGDKITLDFSGDGLINLSVDQATLNAYIENKGVIKANGGQVLMTAYAKDSLFKTVLNNEGVIQAQTIENQNGVIKLLGSMDQGEVTVSGMLDASAPVSGDGGFIETSGHKVSIDEDAIITTMSAQGNRGNWLLDPVDYLIAAAGGDATGTFIANSLANNNFSILASNDITINDAINTLGISGGTLTFQAGKSININADITTANGDVYFYANEELSSGVVNADRSSGAASILMDTSKTINAGTGDITFEIKWGSSKTNYDAGNTTLGVLNGNNIKVNNYSRSGGNTITYGGAVNAAGTFNQYNYARALATNINADFNVAGNSTYFGFGGDISINANVTNTNANGQMTFNGGPTHTITAGSGVTIDASAGDGLFFSSNTLNLSNAASIKGGTRILLTEGSNNCSYQTMCIGSGTGTNGSAAISKYITPVLDFRLVGNTLINGPINFGGTIVLTMTGNYQIYNSPTGTITASALAINNFDGTTNIDNTGGNVQTIAASAPYQSFSYSQSGSFSVGNVSLGGKPETIFAGINSLFPGRGAVSLSSSSGSISIDSILSLSSLTTLTPNGLVNLNSTVAFINDGSSGLIGGNGMLNLSGGGSYRTVYSSGWSSKESLAIKPSSDTVIRSQNFYAGDNSNLLAFQQESLDRFIEVDQKLSTIEANKALLEDQAQQAEQELINIQLEKAVFDSEFNDLDQEVFAIKAQQTEQELAAIKVKQSQQMPDGLSPEVFQAELETLTIKAQQVTQELAAIKAEQELVAIKVEKNDQLAIKALQAEQEVLAIKAQQTEQELAAIKVEQELATIKAEQELLANAKGDAYQGTQDLLTVESQEQLLAIKAEQGSLIEAAQQEVLAIKELQAEQEVLAIKTEQEVLAIKIEQNLLQNKIFEAEQELSNIQVKNAFPGRGGDGDANVRGQGLDQSSDRNQEFNAIEQEALALKELIAEQEVLTIRSLQKEQEVLLLKDSIEEQVSTVNQIEQKIIALRESQEQQELAVIEAEKVTLGLNDQSIQIPN